MTSGWWSLLLRPTWKGNGENELCLVSSLQTASIFIMTVPGLFQDSTVSQTAKQTLNSFSLSQPCCCFETEHAFASPPLNWNFFEIPTESRVCTMVTKPDAGAHLYHSVPLTKSLKHVTGPFCASAFVTGVGNIWPTGCIRPEKSFGLILPRH